MKCHYLRDNMSLNGHRFRYIYYSMHITFRYIVLYYIMVYSVILYNGI